MKDEMVEDNAMDYPSLISQIGTPLVVALVPMVVAVIKKYWAKIPKSLIPVLAAALGPLLDQLLSYTASAESSGVLAAAFGLAGIGLRELKVQVQKALVK